MAEQVNHEASWVPYLQLTIIVILASVVIAGGILIAKAISETIKNTKENLKAKGYTVTDNGVAIKTSKRLDREDYIDATQRGFIKTMSAASFTNAAAEEKKAKKQAKEAEKANKDGWRTKVTRKLS